MRRVQKLSARQLRTGKGISRKEARKFVETICPVTKIPRMRRIVRGALRKSKDKKFADQFNEILLLISKLPDLVSLNTTEYPHPEVYKEIFQKQTDGTYEKEIYEIVLQIVIEWKKAIALT